MIDHVADQSPPSTTLSRRVATQGVLLFAGFGTAQVLSFARNALIGHALSQSNFGIAASIALMLQIVETLSDLGSDRLIVQAEDGATQSFIATSHSVLIARGVAIAAMMLCAAPYVASFFQVAHATTAFQLAAFGPLIKGFTHLEYRRAQRNFDNRPYLCIEIVPQAIALAMTPLTLMLTRDYTSVVALTLVQAATSVMASHALAKSPYRAGISRDVLKRQLSFGWPILLSALPVVAVFQGDRIIVGRLLGMEALAVYSAAFMITMVPGLIANKVSHSLLLPAFADCARRGNGIKKRFQAALEGSTVFAALYLAAFCIAGNAILPIVFGPQYAGHGDVAIWLAAMWAVRMIQSVPGAGLMAYGTTKPFVVAGILRAHAIPCVLWAALAGCSLPMLAAIGVAFEVLSLGYIVARLERIEPELGTIFLQRSLFLVPAAAIATGLHAIFGDGHMAIVLEAFIACALIIGLALVTMPSLRRDLQRAMQRSGSRGIAPPTRADPIPASATAQ